MNYILEITRKKRGENSPYVQKFYYETENAGDTVATALKSINDREKITDINGKTAEKIEWECSCLQKKCGACAMVINGKPTLACSAVLKDLKNPIKLEPLKKFPLICDLKVDRSILYENLKTVSAWLNNTAELSEKRREAAYEGARCLQCGCCLEVCPNFYAGGKFFGASVAAVTTTLLSEMPKKERDALAKEYKAHVYSGCGKSLACRDICPAQIDTDDLLVNSAALAVWKKKN